MPLSFVPLLLAAAAAPPASPLEVTQRVLVERRVAAPDGTVRIATAPAAKAKPGDGLVVSLAYRNTGQVPLGDVVIADPVPAELAYRAPAEGSPAPDVSADGRRFAALAALTIALPGGGSRPATAADIVAVRWRLDRPLAPGAGATLAFRAILK